MVWRLIAERVAAADGADHGARLAHYVRLPHHQRAPRQIFALCGSPTLLRLDGFRKIGGCRPEAD